MTALAISAAPAASAAPRASPASPARSARPAPRTRLRARSLSAQAPTIGQHGELQQPCRRAAEPRPHAARGALRRVRDRHEPSRRDRAADAPGRGRTSASITTSGRRTSSHMGIEEAIADAKAEICSPACAPAAVAVLNRDNRHSDRLAAPRATSASRGSSPSAGTRPRMHAWSHAACEFGQRRRSLDPRQRGSSYHLGAAGEHWVLNSSRCSPRRGARRRHRRGRRRRSPRWRPRRAAARGIGSSSAAATIELIDESYNANPASMRAMLAVLARTEPAPGGRRLLVLGDMRELGEQRRRLHAGLARRGGGERRDTGLPVRPAHGGAVARARRGAEGRAPAGFRRRCAGEVATALRAGDVVWRSRARWGRK